MDVAGSVDELLAGAMDVTAIDSAGEKAFAGYDDELACWERHAVEASDLL